MNSYSRFGVHSREERRLGQKEFVGLNPKFCGNGMMNLVLHPPEKEQNILQRL